MVPTTYSGNQKTPLNHQLDQLHGSRLDVECVAEFDFTPMGGRFFPGVFLTKGRTPIVQGNLTLKLVVVLSFFCFYVMRNEESEWLAINYIIRSFVLLKQSKFLNWALSTGNHVFRIETNQLSTSN